jgi:hypothetical protein
LGKPQANPGNPIYPLGNTTPTGIGPRVHSNRPVPFNRKEMPCVCIWTPEEDSDDKGTNPPKLFRDCDHIIEVMFGVCEDADDRADDYAEAIEALLSINLYLKDPVTGLNTASRQHLARTDLGLVSDDANQIYCSLKLTWRVEYQTEPIMNTDGLGKFDTLHSEYELGGNNENPEAVDHTINIYQPV